MRNRYRLMSTVYDREEESQKVLPEKRIFLSVEGNVTEKEYFDGMSKYRAEIGINAKVDVEVLRRGKKDTNSAPQQVIELLEEYIRLREQNEDDLLKEKRNKFVTELKKIGYDINYRRYLRKYNEELDEFAVLVDRDAQTHSETNMFDCIRHCRDNGYKCFIANPCFEFWLLMHLADIEKEFGERLDEIKENKKISEQHTFVSKEVSDRAHHGKRGINFAEKYMPYIEKAVEQAKKFSSDENDLIDNIGCNLWRMIEELKAYGK
ncbi:MAG: RloB domain-containing protein [Dorea sp.]|nr:RloB domain-containing protein [Dorea sp.]MCI9249206.1 RloB domain-containing protein [Dorea sp.]